MNPTGGSSTLLAVVLSMTGRLVRAPDMDIGLLEVDMNKGYSLIFYILVSRVPNA